MGLIHWFSTQAPLSLYACKHNPMAANSKQRGSCPKCSHFLHLDINIFYVGMYPMITLNKVVYVKGGCICVGHIVHA